MKDSYLRIKRNTNLNGNYINLPRTFISKMLSIKDENFQKIIAIEVEFLTLNKFYYFAYIGGASMENDCIEISQKFSELNNLNDEEYCRISLYNEDIKELNFLVIQPRYREDYELIDDNAEFFEEEFLNQLILVYSGLKSYLCFSEKRYSEIEVIIPQDEGLLNIKSKMIQKNSKSNLKPFILSQDCQVEVKGI